MTHMMASATKPPFAPEREITHAANAAASTNCASVWIVSPSSVVNRSRLIAVPCDATLNHRLAVCCVEGLGRTFVTKDRPFDADASPVHDPVRALPCFAANEVAELHAAVLPVSNPSANTGVNTVAVLLGSDWFPAPSKALTM